ncbi:MAG: putative DNA-binding domain-containing protein [Elusimicrobia bacterium]|nr:putative DNA-binding domain-containing protein [Elusimicrobiota bacterium]
MGQLRALQEELKRLLFVGSTATSSRFWPEALPERLQVYRNTVHGNAYDTLDFDYPMTMTQYSDDAWFDLSEKFFSKFPPASYELNHCVLQFPKFLKASKAKAYVVELAEYELTDLETFISTEVVRAGATRTNPTVSVRVFQHQILDWVLAGVPSAKPPAQKPEVLVFFRDLHHDCRVRRADPLLLLMVDHFKTPGACLDDLEPIREKLLPTSDVALATVFDNLVNDHLILT